MTEGSTFRPTRRVRRGKPLKARQRPGPGGGLGIGPPILDEDSDLSDDSDDEESTSSIQPPQPTENQALPSLGLPPRPPFLPEPVTSVITESTTTEILISTTVTLPDTSTSLSSSQEESSTTSRSAENTPTAAPARPDFPLFRETTFATSIGPVSTFSPIGATSGPYPEGTAPTEAAAARTGIQPGAKAGIALGSIAGITLLAGFFFFLFRWVRTRRFHSSITVESSRSRRHGHKRSNSTTFQLAHPPPTYAPHTSTAQQPRDSQVLRDLLAAAHAHQNGVSSDRSSTFDEKTAGVVVENAEIRHSIASWLRRHHPLKLNPMAGGTGSSGGGNGGNMRSSFFSSFSRSNRSSVASSAPRSPGLWPRSPGLTVPSGGGVGGAPVGAMPKSPLREMHVTPGDDAAAAEEGRGRGALGRDGINSVWSDSSDGNGGDRGHRWSRR